MPACATQETIPDQPAICNLFLPVPDTDFRDFLDDADQLARFAPEIITAIEAVRDELLEKVLAYNCCRSILLRQRQREELERAA